MAELPRFFWLWVKNGLRPWLQERVNTGIDSVYNRKVGVAIVSSGALLLLVQLFFLNRERRRRRLSLRPLLWKDEEEEQENNQENSLDVIVVGAGPAGSASAFYLASAGARVTVLERAAFPRDKICGDVVVAPMQKLLIEMGVWQRLIERGCFRWLNVAAMVAGTDGSDCSVVGRMRTGRNVAVQRIVLDEEMMWAARGVGALVQERHNVVSAKFNAATKRWTVECENGAVFDSKFLIAADGAESRIARMLNVVTEPPNASGTRSYLRPEDVGSLNADLVLKCCNDGPAALVREPEDYVLVASVSLRGASEIMSARERESMIGLVKTAISNGKKKKKERKKERKKKKINSLLKNRCSIESPDVCSNASWRYKQML